MRNPLATRGQDLAGWTRTGGRKARSQPAEPLPGGGTDWSRPRTAPDNSPAAIARRVAPWAIASTLGLPMLWAGLRWAVPAYIRYVLALQARWMDDWSPLLVSAIAAAAVLVPVALTALAVYRWRRRPAGATTGEQLAAAASAVVADLTTLGPAGVLALRVLDPPYQPTRPPAAQQLQDRHPERKTA